MSSSNGDVAVGYGRPPEHTRFKKGESGNPRGRPRALKTEDIDVLALIDQPVEVVRNGVLQRMSPKEIELRRLVQKALKEDSVRTMIYVIGIFERYGVLVTPKAVGPHMIFHPRGMPTGLAAILYFKHGPAPWTDAQIARVKPGYIEGLSAEEREALEKYHPDLLESP